MNNIVSREETLKRLKVGVDTLANVVKTTSGSKGKTFLLRKDGAHPTKDGITIANHIHCEGEVEELACDMLRDIAKLQVEQVGDGTTAVITIAQKLISNIIESSKDHLESIKELEEMGEKVEFLIKKMSKRVNSKKKATQIATTSSNNDFIGKLVGNISWEARNNGVIHVEESENGKTEIFQDMGSRYNTPYEFRHFLNSKSSITIDNPIVNVLLKEVRSFDDVLPLINHAQKENRHCVIIAPDYHKMVLDAITYHVVKEGGEVMPLFVPDGDKVELAKDIYSLSVDDNVERVIVDKMGYTLFTKDITPQMSMRANQILEQKVGEQTKYLRDKLDDRVSTLTQKVFTIYVGGLSQSEKRELKDRIDDALLATRAAIVDGYVLGGGVALRNIASQIESDILKSALEAPYRQILENAAIDAPSLMGNEGVNTTTSRIEDFEEVGIIDPTAVILNSVRNAISLSKTIISLNGCIL